VGDIEILRTKGRSHTDLTGYQEVRRDYSDQIITDRFRVVRKLDSQEDAAGNCYDRYEIDHHNTIVDRTPVVEARLDYLCMMLGVDLPEEGGADDGAQPEV
jgi:hypothetical protein